MTGQPGVNDVFIGGERSASGAEPRVGLVIDADGRSAAEEDRRWTELLRYPAKVSRQVGTPLD